MVQQMMGSAAADNGNMNGVMEQVQGMLNPLLTQAAASATSHDPTLQPAITQILDGFTALTQALGGSRPAQSSPDSMHVG